ncbi:nuclear exosome regulator NRDE2 [Tribolium castaneum]|uniref:Protein NRDE2 homolog-like Protein n=1 Tax=Tribolium castaneum TaxID=7070 RepID=D6W9C7_TRICA|nr:PREDICTED: protein NRDE2 homolog [Tribolium castaneum]EEZ98481.1 Protein NRDE2 homolog-like Protein [Tribolium castaneum]|eukprot:XP_969760.1 PREDICTED: protein NRDE2 homolog [Tribolium castaneum]
MSLFPAYAGESAPPEQPPHTPQWLQNPSFSIDVTGAPEQPPEEEPPQADDSPEPKKRKKKHKHKDKPVVDDNKLEEEGFILDTVRTKEFLTVKTIARPSAPRYSVRYYVTGARTARKRKKIKRYYHWSFLLEDKKEGEEEVITEKNRDSLEGSKKDENFAGFKQEEDLSQTTASFNKKLAESPHDIKLWLEYVNFQDMVYQFEKTYRKGSIAKGLRVLAERKLAILDKALTHNQNCEELLRERLNVAVSIYPSDELQVQLKNLVDKDQGNIILWQGYIESIQCSMSHCNTPSVLDLYTKCLSILHKLRRNSSMEKAQLEENILKMLYQCGLFLKQAGLFEQLWTLLRLYLELNLSPTDKNKFNIGSGFDEKQLVELEEVVFNSQLPLHELWLRTEKLREACHWLPWMEDGECEDPQRLVFPDDVAELIHPITMPENMFRLIATILSLLKIPILFCRHSTMQELGLDYVPWALDSIESLIGIFLPLYPIDLTNKNLVIDSRLSVGPQYLKVLPGQEEYLSFVLTTMKSCTECLSGDDKIAMTVWWLRFQRLLIILEKQGRFKMPQGLAKKIKSNVKNLLKQEENRSNTIFYCEYALIEFELGNPQTCLNIIQTALSFHKPILAEKASRCHLHRTLVEVCLSQGKDSDALQHLICYALEKTNIESINDDLLNQTTLKFKHTTLQLLQTELEKLPVANQFLPNFFTDWIICNGWFLYLTKGALQCGTFLENILADLDEKHEGMLWQKEVLFEFYVAVLFKHCVANPGFGVFKILDDVLTRAVELYPNNLFLLAVLAKEQSVTCCAGSQWWKLKSLLMKTGRAFPILFLVLIANQQMVETQEKYIETFSGRKYEVSDSHKNRMLALFRHITRPEMCTRRCGLVWRLYLQFVHAYFDPNLCRNVYFCAVEECPWLKALYIDAAIYIPAELAQIQDLLIEKQLRIHVTPEELDVLRS